jgi:hypothetical protein
MCDNCFTTEIFKFESQKQWTAFDLELTQKLGQGKLKQTGINGRRIDGDEQFKYVYQCLTCGQEWELDELHDHGDGHFLKLSTYKKLTARQRNNRQLGLFILLLIIVFILVRVIFG